MNNGFKTSVVDPDKLATTDQPADETLAAQALDQIRGAERLSGFGRFATKMQGLFQASAPSYGKTQSAHLKIAPIMMSAGLLLLVATGLLFLLSKPQSTVQTRFRQPTELAGAENRARTVPPNSESVVTENQLVGADTTPEAQARRAGIEPRTQEDFSGRRFTFDDHGASAPSAAPAPMTNNDLQTPATVFIATPVLNAALAPSSHVQRGNEVQLPAGTEIIAHTTNAISSGLESPVIAVVDRSVQVGNSVVIPQGARVIGYTAGAVKDRINVRFTSLLLPNNREVAISGLALMKDGSAGLVGKVKGSGHPVLAGAGRVATGAAALAIQFAGQNSGSLDQPFSQGDYLRNRLAAEVASQGSHYSNRLQQPMSIPIVTVKTNQPIRIFLLNSLGVSGGRVRDSGPLQDSPTAVAEQNLPPEQALAAAQTVYIQALEAQLAEMRAALDARQPNGRR